MFDEFSNSLYKIAFSAWEFFGKFFQIAIFQNVFWTVSSYYWEMMKQKYQKLLISRLVSFRSFLFVFSLLIATLEVMKATTIYILTHHPLSIFTKGLGSKLFSGNTTMQLEVNSELCKTSKSELFVKQLTAEDH